MQALANLADARQETDTPLLEVRDLRVTFAGEDGDITAVEDLSFAIAPGETVCIVGESGSGKSVTSLSITRLVEFGGGRIENGQILLDDGTGAPKNLITASETMMRQVRGNQIGMIFQEPITALNPVLNIADQLIEGLRTHHNLSASAARARALELMKQVRIPEPERRLDQFPHELSGGMRQRVMIALALACKPRLLIADEPTTALDVTIQAEILGLINRLQRETGTSIIFITHDMAVVAQIADRVVVMKDGRKVDEAPVDELFASPRHPYTQALLAAVPKLGDMRGKSFPEAMKLVGEDTVVRAPIEGSTKPMLTVEGLTTRFPVTGGILRRVVARVHAVEDVSFTVNAGRTLSLVGESGCGKSTTARSILRLVNPDKGVVKLDGQDITELAAADLRLARQHMQIVFQDPFGSLDPKRRLFDQVAAPLRNFRNLHGNALAERVETLFQRVQLPPSFTSRYPHELSGGQRQRVAIARAIALEPKLVVADEAVSALDVSVQAEVLNMMMDLQAELGLSYLFISHDMAVVERVSHDVGVMYLGRIVEIGPRQAVLENPQHAYTKALLSAVPVADPSKRRLDGPVDFKPIPSPVHPPDHTPEPSIFKDLGGGHRVLVTEGWY
ncbi:MAG: ABC transporter ATP-binding protein [Pseudomonadota bacterium]